MKNSLFTIALSLTIIFLSLLAGCGGESARIEVDSKVEAIYPAPAETTPVFQGPRSNYVLTKTSTGITVEDVNGLEPKRQFSSVRQIQFSNLTIDFEMLNYSKTIDSEKLKLIIELYIAFFRRLPDANGLRHWIGEYKSGKSIESIVESFYQAALLFPNSTGYSANKTPDFFIRRLYSNVLGREGKNSPKADEINYWVGELNKGVSRGTMVQRMLLAAHSFKGDKTWGWVDQLMENRYIFSHKFAVENGISFNSPNDSIAIGYQICYSISPNDTTVANRLASQFWGNSKLLPAPSSSIQGYYENFGIDKWVDIHHFAFSDNSFWTFATRPNRSSQLLSPTFVRFSRGQWSVSGNSISVAKQTHFLPNRWVADIIDGRFFPPENTKGSTVQGVSINLEESAASAPTVFNVRATNTPILDVDFNKPANLDDISGAWKMQGFGAFPFLALATVSVTNIGLLWIEVELQNGSFCEVVGAVTPHESNKNLFNVILREADSSCPEQWPIFVGAKQMSGVAFSHKLANGSRRLILTATQLDQFYGGIFASSSRIQYGTPRISNVNFDQLQYRQNSKITIDGERLDQDLDIEIPACAKLIQVEPISPNKRVYTCKLLVPGTSSVKIRDSAHTVLHTQSITVLLNEMPLVELNTNLGKVVLQLDPYKAPEFVDDFLQTVESKNYEMHFLYQYPNTEVVAFAGYGSKSKMSSLTTYPPKIVFEDINQGVSSYEAFAKASEVVLKRGDIARLSLIKEKKGIYVVLKNNNLKGNSLFGTVVSGLEILDKVSIVPATKLWNDQSSPSLPNTPVVILSVKKLN